MKIAIFFIAFFLNETSPIEWRKLSWQDFRGESRSYAYAAETTTDLMLIPYQKNNRLYFTVKAVFLPEQSFTLTTNEKVLSHEQLHFDITELFARKIRTAINGQPIERIYQIYDSLCVLKNEMQVYYDRETEHSLNDDKQQEWIEYISLQLQK